MSRRTLSAVSPSGEAPLRAVKLQLLLPRSDGPGGVAPQLAENGQRLQRIDIARRGLLRQGAAVIAFGRIIVLQLRRQIAERQADEPTRPGIAPPSQPSRHAPLPCAPRHAEFFRGRAARGSYRPRGPFGQGTSRASVRRPSAMRSSKAARGSRAGNPGAPRRIRRR